MSVRLSTSLPIYFPCSTAHIFLLLSRSLAPSLSFYHGSATCSFGKFYVSRPTSGKNSSEPKCQPKGDEYDATECRLITWKALVKNWKAGKAKAIGVSNFNMEHLQEIIDAKLPLPAVNQIPVRLPTPPPPNMHHVESQHRSTRTHTRAHPTPMCTKMQHTASFFNWFNHMICNDPTGFPARVHAADCCGRR